jgi:hypothetical protein
MAAERLLGVGRTDRRKVQREKMVERKKERFVLVVK